MTQSANWGYWLIVFGIAIIGLSVGINGLTTNTNQDALTTKEIVDASMLESVDWAYYRDYNELKIDKEKFMEVFIRRASETLENGETNEVNFYEIYEAPPKVSVSVKSHSGSNLVNTKDYDTETRVSAIIEVHAEPVESTYEPGTGGNTNTTNPTKPTVDEVTLDSDDIENFIKDNYKDYYYCTDTQCTKNPLDNFVQNVCEDYIDRKYESKYNKRADLKNKCHEIVKNLYSKFDDNISLDNKTYITISEPSADEIETHILKNAAYHGYYDCNGKSCLKNNVITDSTANRVCKNYNEEKMESGYQLSGGALIKCRSYVKSMWPSLDSEITVR